MGVIAFDPEIPVMDRFAKGFPAHADGEPAFYGPWAEAAATAFPFDAHFCAYAQPGIARRLAGQAALAYHPKMVLVVFDVDGPDHKCTPEWWDGERAKIKALFKAHGQGYVYTTRGGYRIVYGLADELTLETPTDAARWRESYLEWIAALKRDFAIECDDKCGDWTRLFRLPRVMRDGEPATPIAELGEAGRMTAWRQPYVDADDPRVLRTASTPIDVPEPAPVEDDKLVEAAYALAAVWPKRGRHSASLALCGALARAGWSDEAIAEFVMCVAEAAEPGNGMYEKRLAQARSSAEKVARGEDVAGWPSLEGHLLEGDETRRERIEEALLATRRALGQGPAVDLFKLASETARPNVRAQLAAAALELRPDVAGDARFAALLDMAAEKLLPAIESSKKTTAPRRYGETFRAMKARGVKPMEWLIRGLVPAGGVGAISAEPKISKTWLAIDLAISVAAGTTSLGKFAVDRPAGAFYLFAEDHESSVLSRVAAVAAGKGLPADGEWSDRLVVQAAGRPLDVTSDYDLCVLVASIWLSDEERGIKTELLIVDPLSDVHSGEEDKRDSMAPVMKRFRALRIVLECAITFVHHSKKVGEGKVHRGGQRMRGSSAIHGAIDFGIYLDNPRGDRKAEFISRIEGETRSGQQAGAFDLKLSIDDDKNGHAVKATFTWSEAEQPAGEGPKDLAEQRAVDVVQKLFDQGAPLTFDELKKKIGGKSDLLMKAVEIAEEEGWIARRFHGQRSAGYEITEGGKRLIRDGTGDAGPAPADPGSSPPIPPTDLGKMLASFVPGTQ
jgi:hypothetical protein